jgi:hypothetical protein
MGADNLLAGRQLQPLILSRSELTRVLLPLTVGYAWGEKTIVDLWTQCAPVPGGTVERRIISPAHLGAWLADVLAKQGRPLSEQAVIYNTLASGGRTHGR